MSDRCQTSHIAARLCSMRGMVVEDFCSVGRLVSVTTNGVVSESGATGSDMVTTVNYHSSGSL